MLLFFLELADQFMFVFITHAIQLFDILGDFHRSLTVLVHC